MRDTRWPPEKIFSLRKAYGETQEDFATRLAVCRETLSHWERGLNCPGGPESLLLDQLEMACKNREKSPESPAEVSV